MNLKNIIKLVIISILLIFNLSGCKQAGSTSTVVETSEDPVVSNDVPEYDINANLAVAIKLNTDRTNVYMISLKENKILDYAAKKHVEYLLNNLDDIGHEEHNTSSSYFYGTTPADRAIKAGFYTRYVLETFTFGITDPLKSIDMLYNGIYHRFHMLSLTTNIFGQYNLSKANVIEFSNSYLNDLCDPNNNVGVSQTGYYITNLCKDLKYIPYELYLNALNKIRINNPNILFFPNDKIVIYPIYQYESPDPLNGIYVAGAPITITINPYYNSNYKKSFIKSFTLKDYYTGEILDTYEINATNDPNQILEPGEFAFYPKEHLKWNYKYTVDTTIFDGNEYKNYSWTFRTEPAPAPIINIPYNNGNAQNIYIKPNKKYLLYIVPSDTKDVFAGLSYEGNYELDIELENYSYIYIMAKNANSGEVDKITIVSRSNKTRVINVIIK